MKARLVNNFWVGNYTDEWILINQNKVINGELVSDWILIDTTYDGGLIKPLWDGSSYVEGATQQEQDNFNSNKNNNEDREENQQNIQDAQNVMNEYNQRIDRKLKNLELDENDVKTIRNRIKDIYQDLIYGWWDVAKDDAASMSTGGNQQVSAELEYFQQLIINY